VFQTQVGSDQIHDFNPGTEASGLFWTAAIDTHDVLVNPGSGRGVMDVRRLAVPDFHDLVNAILGGPSVPGIVSFRVDWAASRNMQTFRNDSLQYNGKMALTSASCAWSGETAEARYISNPDPATQVSVYAQVGDMRNGVFFS
jgi:hypothetical protein